MNLVLLLISQESERLTWANTVIDKQYDLAMIGITIIIALAFMLLAGTWIANFYINRRVLKNIEESLKARMDAKYSEGLAMIDSKLDDETQKIRKENEDIIEERMLLFEADKARLFAIAAFQLKIWDSAACWWAVVMKHCAKAKEEDMLRTAVEAIIDNLGRCKSMDDEDKGRIKKCLCFIPGTLAKERNQIEKKLSIIPSEIEEQTKN